MTTRRPTDRRPPPLSGGAERPRERRPHRGYALAAVAAACWAVGGVMAKWLFTNGSDPVAPLHLAAARAMVSALALGVYLLVARRDALRIRLRDVPFLGFFGVAGLAAMHVAYFAAIERTDVPTAILLEYLAPVIVLAVSVVFLGRRPTLNLPAGVLLSVLGCALVVGAVGGGGLRVAPSGLAWGLAAAVFFAGYILMGERAAGRFSPWTLLFYGLAAASAFWIALLLARGELRQVCSLMASPERAGFVVAISLGATIVPFGAFLAALAHIDATRASITATLEPAIAVLVTSAIPALNEPLSALQMLGGALVIVSCALVQLPERARGVLPPPA